MIERGKRWHLLAGTKVIAYAHRTFDGWDGYLITGEKFPNHQKFISSIRGDRRLCVVRRYVEYAIEDQRESDPVPSGAEKESQ